MISENCGASKELVSSIIAEFGEILRTQVLDHGRTIRLREVGTFRVRKLSARVGRNPRTGEQLDISSSRYVTYTASKKLKSKETDYVDSESK